MIICFLQRSRSRYPTESAYQSHKTWVRGTKAVTKPVSGDVVISWVSISKDCFDDNYITFISEKFSANNFN